MSKKPMYIMSYDHGGYILWGYTFKNAVKSASDWMDKYKKFKIGLDNEAYCYDRYASDAPENIKAVKDTLKKYKGRFSVGSCSYGQPLAVFINEESNIRQITYAVETDLKYFGVRPYVYAISEHALHSQIPQLIKDAGYKMAIMRTHFMMYGYNPTYNSSFGTWYGDDNTGIPTVPTYDGQGAQFASTTMDNYILTRWPLHWHESLEDFEQKFENITPLLASRYDDVISRCEELTAHAEQVDNYKWVVLDDLFDVYKDCDPNKDEYRPKPNEFKVRMPWGYCGNKIFNDTRSCERLVNEAEGLDTFAYLLTGKGNADTVKEAWKHLLITQHHDIQICGRWEDEKEFTEKCRYYSGISINQSAEKILSKIKTTSENNVVLINTSAETIKTQAKAHIKISRPNEICKMYAVCEDEKIPVGFDVTELTADKIPMAFDIRFNCEVPAFSAKVYSVVLEKAEKLPCASAVYRDNILKTDNYEIKLAGGGIVYVKDIKTDKIIINNGGEGRLFSGVINDAPVVSAGKWYVHTKPLQTIAAYKGEIGGIPLSFTLTLNEGDKKLYCYAEFEHNNEDIGYGRTFEQFRDNTNGFVHEEKLRFVMNVNQSEDVFGMRDRPFVPAKTDDKYIEGVYMAYIGTQNDGVAVLNKGSMCLTRESDCVSVPLAYANSYAWGEKRLIGKYSHEFAILPVLNGFNEAAVLKEAREYNYPPVIKTIEGEKDGELCGVISPLDIAVSENVVMTSCFEQNGSVFARFYEASGKDGFAEIKGRSLIKTDLLLNETEKLHSDRAKLAPRKIVTVKIK